MYAELIEKSITNRGNIVEVGQLSTEPADYERYCSLFFADKDLKTHVDVNGSVSGFKGKRTARVLYIDIDNENPEKAFVSLRTVIASLNSKYGINPDDLLIFFSGNKGFHVGIPDRITGQLGWSVDFAEKTKKFISSVVDEKQIDTKIYEPQRIFRIPNSKHGKSGLYKIQLNYNELNDVEKIKELAKKPRPGFKRTKPLSEVVLNSELQFQWQLTGGKKSIEVETQSGDFWTPPAQGERNSKLHKQACALFQNSELSAKTVYKIISVMNKASSHPLDDFEVRNIIQSAAKNEKHKEVEHDVRTLGGWSQEWYDSILPEQNKLSLCFPSFDKELKGKLRGKLIVIVGSAGTKKSLFAKNIVFSNLLRNDSRSIYSTMEMGATDTIDRFINLCIDGFDVNPSYFLETENKQRPGFAEKVYKDKIAKFYEDKLLITQNVGLQTSDYEKMIDEAEQKHGKVDILIPDGLSMMGGTGTETELVNKHTKELKQLAIKKNILILLLVHVTKEVDKYTIDCGKYMRASNKILDNCDAYLSASLIRDEMSDDPEPGKGVIRLVNKRGSGINLDVEYIFDRIRLSMIERTDRYENIDL